MPDISEMKDHPAPEVGTVLRVAGTNDRYEFLEVGKNKDETKYWWVLIHQSDRYYKFADPKDCYIKRRGRGAKTPNNSDSDMINTVRELKNKPGTPYYDVILR